MWVWGTLGFPGDAVYLTSVVRYKAGCRRQYVIGCVVFMCSDAGWVNLVGQKAVDRRFLTVTSVHKVKVGIAKRNEHRKSWAVPHTLQGGAILL